MTLTAKLAQSEKEYALLAARIARIKEKIAAEKAVPAKPVKAAKPPKAEKPPKPPKAVDVPPSTIMEG